MIEQFCKLKDLEEPKVQTWIRNEYALHLKQVFFWNGCLLYINTNFLLKTVRILYHTSFQLLS